MVLLNFIKISNKVGNHVIETEFGKNQALRVGWNQKTNFLKRGVKFRQQNFQHSFKGQKRCLKIVVPNPNKKRFKV